MLPTVTDLFIFFKNSIVQCGQLSVKQPLFDLYRVFKKYLGLYARRILLDNVPKVQRANVASPSPHPHRPVFAQGSLKDTAVQLTTDELCVICMCGWRCLRSQLIAASLLNTAEYCMQTTAQLEAKLKEKVDGPFKDQVDFSDERDAFADVRSSQ